MRSSAPHNKRSEAKGLSVLNVRGAKARSVHKRACSPSACNPPGSHVGPPSSPSERSHCLLYTSDAADDM
eukprot:2749211-Alexandrium_andersonii.AAC.1